ncbi:MAG: DUF4291 domain-containing protein [Pseudomonadota bacterium]
MTIEKYAQQQAHWPHSGRHILAQYDDTSIIVYQAYRPAIAEYAVEHQRFGGEFSYNRMSWIKPNFLWMMYRAGWATKEGQERILAVRLRRDFFDELLRTAVPSSFDASRYATHDQWQHAVAHSDVRLQWDPDHDPHGRPLARRAIQLGLRGRMLRRYGEEDLLDIEDVTPLVREQHPHVHGDCASLALPRERVYRPGPAAAANIGLETD